MKYYLLLFLIFIYFSTRAGVQNSLSKINLSYQEGNTIVESSSSKNMLSSMSRWSICIEGGVSPIASENSKKLYCYQGLLGLGYRLVGDLELGIYGQTLFYHQNTELAQLDNKIIEMSSIDYHTLGASLAYGLSFGKWWMSPKVDVGYNILNAKAIDYPTSPKEFIDYRYLSINPKLRIGYHINESVSLGIYGGYNIQMVALKGTKTAVFDPNTYHVGITALIKIRK